MKVKQTAGRDALGDFAPKFAQLNDEVLFGEVWSRENQLSLRDRSLVTVTALMAQELFPGDVVNIPVGVKHWHGAATYSWFSHLAVEVPGEETSNEWLEPVDEAEYMGVIC
ncbi:hypothetical protein [Lactonifactor longoviformis]|uniref:hypothetical protein n=1 Tax=Lactonifactor longoviformis TaxID=341220 RepID=UPI0036F1983F